ncbi:MAG: phosphate transport system regulatory protein PhoU [Alphaproteobacteria bacterium]|nr:phosphate transport system regulatory protein PhoU [Alphaproteobacteria bacterium]
MIEHTVSAFDRELELLGRKISEMGGIAEKMLSESIEALINLKVEDAQAIIATDSRLDTLQREIEEEAVHIIARRQPLGADLREIIGAMRISGDLERVGDLAKNIAKRTLKLATDQRLPRAMIGLRHMGQLAAMQLKEVLDAYGQGDVNRADHVWHRDAEIDALEDSVFRELLTFMMEDPRNISSCTHLLFCSKNVERAGDHATNIAETVHYIVTGEKLPVDRPKIAQNSL